MQFYFSKLRRVPYTGTLIHVMLEVMFIELEYWTENVREKNFYFEKFKLDTFKLELVIHF